MHSRDYNNYIDKYKPAITFNEDEINNICIKACPLYAANIEDTRRNQVFQKVNFLTIPRKYLYSFQGAYDKQWYLTDIRDQIFKMKHPENCYIKNIGLWHYNNIVYNRKSQVSSFCYYVHLIQNINSKNKQIFYI